MYEIELKAWLKDRSKATEFLNRNAGYDGLHDKHDVYWSSYPHGKEGQRVTIRIRTVEITKPSSEKTTEIIVTYKKHRTATTSTGESCEVNEEKEFTLPSLDAADIMSTFLKDSGFQISLKKHKQTEGWYKDKYHIELCTIDGLGDFIEVETLSENNGTDTIEATRKGILDIFEASGISSDCIETKSYREMLESLPKQPEST